jgi:hypothetical protein
VMLKEGAIPRLGEMLKSNNPYLWSSSAYTIVTFAEYGEAIYFLVIWIPQTLLDDLQAAILKMDIISILSGTLKSNDAYNQGYGADTHSMFARHSEDLHSVATLCLLYSFRGAK